MPLYEIAILGAIGGLIPDVLRIVGERHTGSAPAYLKSWFFWASLVLLSALGAGAAYLSVAYAGAPNSVLTALGIGYGAPSIISKLLGDASSKMEPANDGIMYRHSLPKRPSPYGLRQWWSR